MKIEGIPIVDLEVQCNGDELAQNIKDRIVKELDWAFTHVGFVYLKNHGVQQLLIDNLFKSAKSFFHLTEDVKAGYQCNKEQCDGYTGKNQEILDPNARQEIRESYDVSSPQGRFPDDFAPEFHKAVDLLGPQLCELTIRVLKYMALALGLEEDFFSSRHQYMFKGAEKNRTIFRSLFYPPLKDSEIEPGVIRCGQHHDYGSIILLMQDDMGGLEIMSQEKWIPATPIPGAILVNLGDLMQFWTSDRYVSTIHRVVVPAEEIRRRSPRQSIAFFVHPDTGVIISPLDGSDKHPPVEALAYIQSRVSATYK